MARSNTTFKLGNRAAVGGRGPSRPNVCTQVLLSQLHEIDKTTKKEKVHLLCEQLLKLALGFEYRALNKDGDAIKVQVPPDLAAIKEVIDRVQGKAPIAMHYIGNTIDDYPDDAKVKDVIADLERRGLPIPEGLLDFVEDDVH